MVDVKTDETRKDAQQTVAKVLALLSREYGPVRYRQRWDPVSELVGTILSQNTSDVNSHRAFRSLRETFPSWEEVMQGDVGGWIWGRKEFSWMT